MDVKLDLKRAKKKIWQLEVVGKQQLQLKEVTLTDLEALRSYTKRHCTTRTRNTSNRSGAMPTFSTNNTKPCFCCGKLAHPCEALNVFSKQVSKITPNSAETLDTVFLESVAGTEDSTWYTTIEINRCKLNFKLDIHAEVTAISEHEYKKLN